VKQFICAKLAICALVVLSVSSAFAFQGPQPFSADFSTTSPTHNIHSTGKIFVAIPKMRVETVSTGKEQAGPFGGNINMIMDLNAKTSYMLMPQQHMYMEFHTDQNSAAGQRMPKIEDLIAAGDPCAGRTGATCKKIGPETVNGRACEKWEMTEKAKTSTYWFDIKLRFPVKMVLADGMTTEYTNIKEGNQDASLFQVPAGYTKFDAASMGRPPR
jgi:hypothetical protein